MYYEEAKTKCDLQVNDDEKKKCLQAAEKERIYSVGSAVSSLVASTITTCATILYMIY